MEENLKIFRLFSKVEGIEGRFCMLNLIDMTKLAEEHHGVLALGPRCREETEAVEKFLEMLNGKAQGVLYPTHVCKPWAENSDVKLVPFVDLSKATSMV